MCIEHNPIKKSFFIPYINLNISGMPLFGIESMITNFFLIV